jgi:hypothetical protein
VREINHGDLRDVGNGGVSPPRRRGERTLGARRAEEATGPGSRVGSCLARKGRNAGDKKKRKETRASSGPFYQLGLRVRPMFSIRPVFLF